MIRHFEDMQIHPWSDYKDDPPLELSKPHLLDTSVYACYSVDPFSPQFAQERERDNAWMRAHHVEGRALYPALPLTVRGMMGTKWVNVHTGTQKVICSIGYSRWGNPTDNFDGILSGVGLWWHKDRYVVDKWVLLGNCPDLTLANWSLHRLRFCVDQLRVAIQRLEEESDSFRRGQRDREQEEVGSLTPEASHIATRQGRTQVSRSLSAIQSLRGFYRRARQSIALWPYMNMHST